MKQFFAFCAVAWLAGVAAAHADPRPLVIEDNARIVSPDPRYSDFGDHVASEGNWAIVTARRLVDDEPGAPPTRIQAAFLFQRVGTSWNYVRLLQESRVDREYEIDTAVAMEEGIAAVQTGPLVIYEFNGTDWVVAPTGTLTRDGPGTDIEIDGGRIIVGDGTCAWGAYVYARDSTGTWQTQATLRGGYKGCDDEFRGGPVDLQGQWAVVFQPNREDYPNRTAYIYRHYPDGNWYENPYGEARLDDTAAVFGSEVASRNADIFVSGSKESGTYVFRETPAYGFHLIERFQPVDSFMGGGVAYSLEQSGNYLLHYTYSYDRDQTVVYLFAQRDSKWAHVVTLQSRNGTPLGGVVSMSGNRVLVGGNGTVFQFELPANLATPAPLADDFESGSAAGWNFTTAASNFTIATAGGTRVLRQSGSTGEARAVLRNVDWKSQSIEADVRPTQFNGANAWLGLATRYQNADNYYLATLSATGVQFRRVINGVTRTLATTAVAVSANSNHHFRFESVGTQHRVFLDGEIMIDINSTGFTHGAPALFTSSTRADFDNVNVTPSPRSTIYRTNFEAGNAGPWTLTGPGFWNLWSGQSTVYYQSSLAGDARAVIGAPTDDQVVRVNARLDTFASATGSQERWFGVLARYTDVSNYYYLSLRSSNTLQLRKLVNGSITTLASVPFTVENFRWYQLRLDVVGSRLRAFVDGVQRLEVSDTSHARGVSGPVTYKTAADFDNFLAVQP